MKEYRQKQPLKGRAASLDSDFKLNPIKPLVPLIGSSMKPRCDPLPDVGIPTYRSDGQGEIMDDMIKGDLEVLSTKTPLRDISNDQSVPNMEARITMASPNVSTVVLKRIDPKLRPPKKIIEASTSPSTNHGEDTMIHEDMLDDFDQGKPEVDSDGIPRYTWTNRQPLPHLAQERIDRVFVNASWNVLYPKANVKHLEISHSNHSPVLLSLSPDHGSHHPCPFRFQSMWLSHPSFPSLKWASY
ncbi:hypothetical protein CFP56_029456 [Quercus suber]|uniref:Endonuclease/exonuclease/phosphatase n=1 Tax=Quercus suber TaxID=58331 RepID=A0AAW0JQX9_QUESU